MKRILLLVFLGLLVSLRVSAQVIETEDEPPVVKRNKRISTPPPAPQGPTRKFIFEGNHDFYLTVNNEARGKVAKGERKEVKLGARVHKVVFEEADSTGERLERWLRLTPEAAKRGDTVYAVSFKEDIDDVIAALTGVAEKKFERETAAPSNHTTTAMTVKQSDSPYKPIADELAEQTVAFPAGSVNISVQNASPREVNIAAMRFGKFEVTQQQWQAVMGANKSAKKNCPSCPVESVSWNEVAQFIERLNKAGGKTFRLPTEAEWQYVARKVFAQEIGIPGDQQEYVTKHKSLLDRTAWYNAPRKGPSPVGGKEAVLEVHDLFGNVAEWCADEPALNAPGGTNRKPIRGGSFKDADSALTATARDSELPSASRPTLGFRLVLAN